MEKPCAKKIDMLLETISSDDNMTTASESEEDGALVLSFYNNYN